MVANAKTWAENQGLTRTNAVHGATEYRVPTDWTFGHKDVDRVTTKVSSSCELQAVPPLLIIDLAADDATPHVHVLHGFDPAGRMGRVSFWGKTPISQLQR